MNENEALLAKMKSDPNLLKTLKANVDKVLDRTIGVVPTNIAKTRVAFAIDKLGWTLYEAGVRRLQFRAEKGEKATPWRDRPQEVLDDVAKEQA